MSPGSIPRNPGQRHLGRIACFSDNAAVKSRIASVTDDLFFFSGATVEDICAKFCSGIYPAFDDALFRRMGQAFDLPAKTPVRRFSKGMQKQAAFWLTIACRPELMVLDEPVDGGWIR